MQKRLLVRAPNWLGDAVMATPFLKRLAAKTPGAEIDVLAKPGLVELFSGAPGVHRVIPIDRADTPWTLGRKIRAQGYETLYILPPSFSSALSGWIGRVPNRIGYAADFRRPLLTEARPLDERFHYVRRYLGLLGETGANVDSTDLYIPRASEEETDRFLEKAGGVGAGKVLAIAPGSRAPARRWFPDRFAAVIDRLGPNWSAVLLLGAPEDRPYADAVARLSSRPVRNLCGQTSVPLAASILARSTVLLTNESGLMHVGWAAGVPLVVLAGPSNPRVTSPFGPRVQVLQTHSVPCVPCVRNECDRPQEEYLACLKRISVKDVVETILELTHTPRGGGPIGPPLT